MHCTLREFSSVCSCACEPSRYLQKSVPHWVPSSPGVGGIRLARMDTGRKLTRTDDDPSSTVAHALSLRPGTLHNQHHSQRIPKTVDFRYLQILRPATPRVTFTMAPVYKIAIIQFYPKVS